MQTRELIYLLNRELAGVRKERGSHPSWPFIARAYASVARKLADNFRPTEAIDRRSIDELHATKQITQHMKKKLMDLLDVKLLSKSPDMKKKFLFDELHWLIGIGPKRAKKLIDDGLQSITDLKKPKWWSQLNTDTQTALATQPLKKIPHEEIARIESTLVKYSGAKVVLVGSYRRGTATSRDIDIMLVSTKTSALGDYLKYLDGKVPHIYLYSKGADKMSLVLEFDARRKFKVDVFRTHPDYYWAHLLYATGSKTNNIKMRVQAKRMGMLLNQKGLWRGTERVLGATANERAYYWALNAKYLPPNVR